MKSFDFFPLENWGKFLFVNFCRQCFSKTAKGALGLLKVGSIGFALMHYATEKFFNEFEKAYPLLLQVY
jgi:hypothetical protein